MARGQRKAAPHFMEPLLGEYVVYRTRLGRQVHKGNESVLRRFCKEWDHETRNESPNRLVDNLTGDWVEDYFLELYGEREPVTKRAYQSQLKQFIVWMQKYGVSREASEFNPGFTAGKSLRKKLWLSADQMREAWEAEPEVYWATMFMWLALTCCRINELQSVKWGDLVGDQWNIQRKKTYDLNSFLRLTPRLRAQLRLYKMWYRAQIGRQIEADDFVFPQIRNTVTMRLVEITDPKRRRGDLAHRKIKSMIVRVMPWAEKLVGIGCHTLRRSGAQALLESLVAAGVEHALKIVSVILGHEKVSTTEDYLNTDMFKMAANQALELVDLYGPDSTDNVIPITAAAQG